MRIARIAPFLLLSSPALADQDTADARKGQVDEKGNILVIADTIRGQIKTDLPPVMVLEAADIQAYGASTIGELIEAVSPQTSSGRGRGGGHPVILLNGQRISSFRILRNIPPEAIRRMEVLPEEVALRFGYPPNQRLINMILKDDYASRTLAGEYNAPTRGGFGNWELEGSWLNIDGPRRLNIETKIVAESLLTEGERDVLQEAGGIPSIASDPDPADFRSLVDASRDITANASWSTGLGKDGLDGTLGLDASYARAERRSLSGLDTVRLTAPDGSSRLRSLPRALTRRTASDTFEGGIALNKPLGGWQLSATIDTGFTDQLTRVDRRADLSGLIAAAGAGALDISGPLPSPAAPGFDTARFRNLSAASLATLTGQPFRLPAGDVSLTLKAGFDFNRSVSADSRTVAGQTRLKRGDASTGANIVLPLTSRKEGVAGAIGDISLNFSGGINHLSDFGTLTDWSAGLTWSPTGRLTFQSSYIVGQAAPSLGQLGNPQVLTLNVPVYDFMRGQTVLARIVTGGNPGLRAETQRDIKLSMNWELPVLDRSSLLVEYFRNSSGDVTQSFPLLTPAVEAAFPSRVTRDGTGRLVAIDRRPVTFDKLEASRLRWGLNLSGHIGEPMQHGAGDRGGPGPQGWAPPPAGGRPPLPGGRPPDPAAFAGMRAQLCTQGAEPDPAKLPEPMQQRLRGPDGKFDPARLAGLRERVCSASPDAPGRQGAQASAGRPGSGTMGFGRGAPRGGRWNLALYHTVRFTDRVTIAPGGPVLDQLTGDAIAAGGVPRHAVELEGGFFYRGFGLRLNGNWSAPATVRASGAPGSSDLRFGSVTRLDARIFVDFGMQEKLVGKAPFLKGMRLAFEIDNIFDSRQKVTDASGAVPFAFQSDYRDPRGRFVGIDLRKMF